MLVGTSPDLGLCIIQPTCGSWIWLQSANSLRQIVPRYYHWKLVFVGTTPKKNSRKDSKNLNPQQKFHSERRRSDGKWWGPVWNGGGISVARFFLFIFPHQKALVDCPCPLTGNDGSWEISICISTLQACRSLGSVCGHFSDFLYTKWLLWNVYVHFRLRRLAQSVLPRSGIGPSPQNQFPLHHHLSLISIFLSLASK